MLNLTFAVLALAMAMALGAAALVVIASLPVSLLERTQHHGRFAGLGATEEAVGSGKSALASSIPLDGRLHTA